MNAIITRDILVETGIMPGKGIAGAKFEDCKPQAEWTNITKGRLYDDDGECYYHVEFEDDPHARTQYDLLQWAAHHSGCTTIKVWEDGKLVQIIG